MTPQCAPPISAAEPRTVRRAAVLVALAAGVLASCGRDDGGTNKDGCRPVVALVASSVVDAFTDHAGNVCAGEWKVTGGSSTALAAQVQEGSPADGFLSAGIGALDQLRKAGRTVGEPVALGSVRAALLVPIAHNEAVTLRDLPTRVRTGWKVGVCAASVPCGAMADQLLANAAAAWGDGYDRAALAATEAASAGDLGAKVAMGEIDAAIIYESACGSPRSTADTTVRCIDIPDTVEGNPLNVRTPYFAVRLNDSSSADSFMVYVSSAKFRAYLSEWLRIK